MLDKISIILPVRNGYPYLEECLDSIVNQSYQNWELHIVNDNSTDNTQHILDTYAKRERRIHPSNSLGTGIIDALNTGYDLSKGEYITRMDADDIMPPKKLEVLLNLLKTDTSLSVATGCVTYFCASGVKDGYKSYETWLNQLCRDNNHFQHIYKECVIASPAWLMRRDHFDSIGGFKSDRYPEDYDLCFRMYENNVTVIPTETSVHLWRDHSTRTSRNDDNYADNRFLALKLDYFKKIETPKYHNFILVGAGKKGKKIAAFLLENNISFSWTTNNQKKIGIDIYGKILQDYDQIDLTSNKDAVLVSVANKEEQSEIKKRLSNRYQKSIYYFC